MKFPVSLLGLASQIPLGPSDTRMPGTPALSKPATPKPFALKEGPDIFSPYDLVRSSVATQKGCIANGGWTGHPWQAWASSCQCSG